MAVDLQVPVGVRREPVVLVAVQDDGGLVPDPAVSHQRLERGLVDEVALQRVLQVVLPVQLGGTGNVALVVEIGVLVDFGDGDPVVCEVLGEPLGGDEHRLRIAVLGHQLPPDHFTN